MRTELLNETSLYVTDLKVAEMFYENVIGLKVARRIEGQRSTLRYDDSILLLFQARTAPTADEDATSGSHELGQVSFGISASDLSFWREHLQRHDVPIEGAVAWPNGAQSITCRDPAGNRIELKTQGRSHEMARGDRGSRAISSGLNAQWKLFQAANLGVKRTQDHS